MNEKKQSEIFDEILEPLIKTDALMHAADMLVGEFRATPETSDDHARFTSLFYMALDSFRELKAKLNNLR